MKVPVKFVLLNKRWLDLQGGILISYSRLMTAANNYFA